MKGVKLNGVVYDNIVKGSNVIEDSEHRLVTDAEKAAWINKIYVNNIEQTLDENQAIHITVDTASAAAAIQGDTTETIESLNNKITILNGSDTTTGSVAKQIKDSINTFATEISDDGTINTFKELVDYAATHNSEYSTLAGIVSDNTSAISDIRGGDTTNTIKSLADAIDNIDGKIESSLEVNLSSEKDQTAGTDGLALHIKEEYGKITELSGSIAANTYDAYGAASAVETSIKNIIGTPDEGKTIQQEIDSLEASLGSSNVETQISNAIADLDSSTSQTAGADGLALSVTQTDGKITQITGSITANTYDAYGSASAVDTKLYNHTNDSTIHIADTERTAWNKNTTDITTLVSDENTDGSIAKSIKDITGTPDNGETLQSEIDSLEDKLLDTIEVNLNSEKTQTAGTDGLALHIKEVDGAITEFSGSIASNTYDAYGAASSVQTNLTNHINDTTSHITSAERTKWNGKQDAIAANTYDSYGAASAVQGDTTETVKSVLDKVTAITKTDGTLTTSINTAIQALDATPSQTSSSDNGYLALSLTEVDGKITTITGSITDATYDSITHNWTSADNTRPTVAQIKDYVAAMIANAIGSSIAGSY